MPVRKSIKSTPQPAKDVAELKAKVEAAAEQETLDQREARDQQEEAAARAAPSAARPKPATTIRADSAAGLVSAIHDRMKLKADDEDREDYTTLADDSVMADVTEWIPSGFFMVDTILGGGWPVGRISEVFGVEGGGKTASAHLAIQQCQRKGGIAALVDGEHALDKAKMQQLGIDKDRLLYATPKSAEKAFNYVVALVDEFIANPPKHPVIIVYDSTAAIPTQAELDGAMEDQTVGAMAKLLSRAMRMLFRRVAKARVHLMLINQERVAGIGKRKFAGAPETDTPGGKAVRYAASIRVRCSKVVSLPGPFGPSGHRVKMKTVKNRLSPPNRTAEFTLDYIRGPSPACTAFNDFVAKRALVAMSGPGSTRLDPVTNTRERQYTVPWHPTPVTQREFLDFASDRTNVAWRDGIAGVYLSLRDDLLRSGGFTGEDKNAAAPAAASDD